MSSEVPFPVPNVVLQSSFSMPVIALGTGSETNEDGDVVKAAAIEAIKLGYRHFDTASFYDSEQPLGQAISDEALQLGLITSRDELFITSKLWLSDNHPHLVLPALQNSLKCLGLDYLDLYLVHCPMSAKPEIRKFAYEEHELMPFDMKGVWASMEQCHNLGLTKSIGVSNFSTKKLQHLLSFASIPPAVNQVELNPSWQQKNLGEYCKGKGIVVTAYSPLGARGTSHGGNGVMDNELLKKIAHAHGKTVAQVSLRWLYEQGVTFAVRSYNKERMKQNLEIYDFSLTNDDYQKISGIKQERKMNGPAAFDLSDLLWDGEI